MIAIRVAASHQRCTLTLHIDNLFNARYTTFGVYGLNPLGVPGGPRPESPTLERFLTPGYPRAVTIAVTARFF